jgi:hypothetical protein
MKQITITPPQGYEVDKEKSTFETIVFKEIEKKPTAHEFLTNWLNENRLKLRAELGEDRIIWYRGDQWIFDIDFKNKRFRCYYYEFWGKLETEYLLSYKQIQEVVKDVLLKTFNCEGFTPWYLPVHHRLRC